VLDPVAQGLLELLDALVPVAHLGLLQLRLSLVQQLRADVAVLQPLERLQDAVRLVLRPALVRTLPSQDRS